MYICMYREREREREIMYTHIHGYTAGPGGP